MNATSSFSRLLFLLFVTIVWLTPLGTNAQPEPVRIGTHKAHHTRLLAKFKEPEKAQGHAAKLRGQGHAVRNRLSLVPGLVVLEEADGGGPRDAKGKKEKLIKRMADLQTSGLFEYVEPDYQVLLLSEPSDAAFTNGTLWGLRNTGQNGGTSDSILAIGPATQTLILGEQKLAAGKLRSV